MCSSSFSANPKTWKKNLSIKKPQQIEIIENAEDGEAKQSASTLEQQRKHTHTHKNHSFSVFFHLLCETKNTGSEMEKNKNNKMQKTGGQMKKCGVKNRIFTCKKMQKTGREMKTYKG